MEPSTPNTPNRAGRYIVYENKENDDVTKANPRVAVVEKTVKGKETKNQFHQKNGMVSVIKKQETKTNKKVKKMPLEYTKIEGYDWFTGKGYE